MQTQHADTKTKAAEALELLEQAWAYYTPETPQTDAQREPELFEYANAA
ncbi:hypothetical protein [Ruegeria meonggei]|uniref:Uncharacterized protein n=1 Tax=Ruegeria meonggei TaxID=1446476 RepID=A0A1X6ZGE5_9RHOB|nr:hypothetical protein [Ruegeria meonggei]SLN50230.1 hypothetical protein RUM8411_02378 [Ruegeria meonggei]